MGSLFLGWLISLGICLFLSYENLQVRSKLISEISKSSFDYKNYPVHKKDWDIFGLEDMNFFREQGKVDGKIEALLILNKNDSVPLEEEQIKKIIEIAEKSSSENLNKDSQFLSLLCQAAYHKGIASAEENAKESIEEEYAKGYHKAIEDFSCPETGKMVVNPKELDMKKPSK